MSDIVGKKHSTRTYSRHENLADGTMSAYEIKTTENIHNRKAQKKNKTFWRIPVVYSGFNTK